MVGVRPRIARERHRTCIIGAWLMHSKDLFDLQGRDVYITGESYAGTSAGSPGHGLPIHVRPMMKPC